MSEHDTTEILVTVHHVTAVGASSVCPDRDDAVDAEITVAGVRAGVTLLVDDGCASTWGPDPEHWAEWPLVQIMDSEIALAIECAVTEAL